MHLPFLAAPPSRPPCPPAPHRAVASMSSAANFATQRRTTRLARFPPLPHRDLMLDLASALHDRLDPLLLPSDVPADVLAFANAAGTSYGSVDIRRANPGSPVEIVLESWMHCALPSGAVDISSLITFMNGSTDAPHMVLELIQGSPTSLVAILDLVPRRCLAVHPEYIDAYYQNTELDHRRQAVDGIPQARPYRSPSLYLRTLFSPTAVVASINCVADDSGPDALEEIIRTLVRPAAEEVLRVWLDRCAALDGGHNGAPVDGEEIERMAKRDALLKEKLVEVDLAMNLPRMFDAEVAGRVIHEIQTAMAGSQIGKN